MRVKGDDNPPAFYKAYVKDIIERVEYNADLEFECLWREREAREEGARLHIVSDEISDKINRLNDFIASSELYEDEAVRRSVLHEFIPPTLLRMVPLETIMQRVPDNYLRSVFSATLASRFMYANASSQNEMSFYLYMREHVLAAVFGRSGAADSNAEGSASAAKKKKMKTTTKKEKAAAAKKKGNDEE